MHKNIIHLIAGPIAVNCWIYRYNESDAAVIDPGGDAEKIISALKKNSLAPEFILLTHGHFDHIGAVTALKTEYPQIKIAIHKNDAKYIGPDADIIQKQSLKAAMGDDSFLNKLWHETPPEDIILEEGSVVGPFTVIHTPGHTGGSICFWDKNEKNLFTGDTLFRHGYGRTDLPDSDADQMRESLRRLFVMDKDIAVYPGHGRTTTINDECGH